MTVAHITPADGNIFADLGLPDAEELQVKSRLALEIQRTVRELGLKQGEAAARMGITQPKLSNILRGRFAGVSEDRLMRCLAALGRDVTILVGRRHEGAGKVEVREHA
ncbi:MAG TPA: helix-turn-helix transcriptional regulator [Allosphingosinicella sp.]|nr:helix-turn-helix transcriptional regulator [Allosphingosinicella sp.]